MLFYDFNTLILSSSSDLKFEEFSNCMSFDTYSVRFNTEKKCKYACKLCMHVDLALSYTDNCWYSDGY